MAEKLLSHQAFLEYLETGSRSVDGYLQSGSVSLIWSLFDIQDEISVTGDIAEIGVYHGKLFILLCHALRQGEKAFAIDVFDSDHEIQGIRTAEEATRFSDGHLRSHLDNFGIGPEAANIVTANSQDLCAGELLDKLGGANIRLFSVDGDHSRQGIMHDLELASQAIHEDGVILVDDVFNALCPGQTEGIQDYFREHNEILEPIAIASANGPLETGASKLLVATRARARLYKAYLSLLNREDFKLAAPYLGFEDVLIFHFPDKPSRFPLDDAVRRAVAEFMEAE